MGRFLLKYFGTLPNQITGLRLLSIPILWALAVLRQPFYLGLGIAFALVTDVLDGFLARRLKLASPFGSQLDSIADNILVPSGVVWAYMFRPHIWADHPVLSLTAVTVYALSIAVGLVKFRRFGNLHLHFTRVAGVILYLFAAQSLMASDYNPIFFYVACIAHMLASTESLAVLLTRSQVDEHIGSIVFDWIERP